MKILFGYAVLIIILSVIIFGCTKDSIPTAPVKTFSISEFPLEIGNKWVYSVEDTMTGTVDTIQVLSIDTTTLFNNEPATVWIAVDTGYGPFVDFVSVVGDTVKFYRDRSTIPYRILIFPLEIGAGWSFNNQYGWDTVEVSACETIDVPAGSYEAYRVDYQTSPMMLDMVRASSVWISPEIGIVRMDVIDGFRIVEHYEIWRLIEFHPAT